MLRIITVVFTVYLTIASSASGQGPQLEFQSVTSAAGKFTAVMPGKPKEHTEEINSPIGKLELHKLWVEVSKDLVFIIVYCDYPAEAVRNEPQTVLKGARDGLLVGKRKLIEDKELTLGKDKIAGRALVIEVGTLHYRARHFLAGRRLYQVVIVGSKDAVTSPNANKYFDSFEITK